MLLQDPPSIPHTAQLLGSGGLAQLVAVPARAHLPQSRQTINICPLTAWLLSVSLTKLRTVWGWRGSWWVLV